jgi:hypothetical protein
MRSASQLLSRSDLVSAWALGLVMGTVLGMASALLWEWATN